MQIAIHILRKDARHLWREVALTLALLVWLTHLDSGRSGYLPGITEGWLNLLLPLAWGYLSAACVLQDPIPGERQFWLAIPCPRGQLLASKALFLAIFIHLPYLISNVVTMASRGFAPWQFVPRLAQQQLLLMFAITLPCLALATLVRNAMQFIVATVAILGLAVVFVGSAEPGAFSFQPAPFIRVDEVRQWMAMGLLAVFSVAVAVVQYRTRRSRISQLAGAAGLLAVAALVVWLPPEATSTVELALLPSALRATPVTLSVADRRWPFESNAFVRNGVAVAIPLSMTNAPSRQEGRFQQLSFELIEPNGIHHKAEQVAPRSNGAPLLANIGDPDWEILTLERSLFQRLADVPVTLRGYLTVQRLVDRPPVSIPASGPVSVADRSHCFRGDVDGGLLRENGLRVVCESPAGLSDNMIRLTDTKTGHAWEHGLGMAMSFVTYPRSTWLSPVERKEAFYQLTAMDTTRPGSQWMVPNDIGTHSRLEVVPRALAGQSATSFELRGIRLRRYLMKVTP